MDLSQMINAFFHNPPLLLPCNENQKVIIEQELQKLALTDYGRYEERLIAFNKRCDEFGMPHFPKVSITVKVISNDNPNVEDTATPVKEDEPKTEDITPSIDHPVAPKKRGRKASPKSL